MTAAPPPEAPAEALRRYYEASTGRFLRFGGSGRARAIHRGLYPAGVTDAVTAAAEINRRIAAALERLGAAPPARLRDLGCGVGGSLLHFARRWPSTRLEGVTLSPRQASLARRFAAEAGLAGRLHVRCGDFLAPDPTPADVVVAIESHVHAHSAAAFLTAGRAHLRTGGHLVLVDDMLARPEASLSPAEARLIARFRRGWHLGHVPDVEGLPGTARAAGLVLRHSEDLTGHLRLNRHRDRALRAVAPLAEAAGLGRWPLFSNMIGGNALTGAYRAGLMRYRLTVFTAA